MRLIFTRNFHKSSINHRKMSPLAYAPPYKHSPYIQQRIGGRETVGYGQNGQLGYYDTVAFPFPSIRFKEPTQEILALRERERGDWKRLSKEDKKRLYRASFCQTFVEFKTKQPLNHLKIIGWVFMTFATALMAALWIEKNVYPKKLPKTFLPGFKRAQMRRMLELQVNPIQGLSSNWDYEKNDWKTKSWWNPPNPYISCPEDDDDGSED